MKIHIICVAYERVVPLEILIRSFLVQTNPNWVLHIVYDGPAPQSILDIVAPFVNGNRKDERIRFYESSERYQRYGHPNRRTMLQTITTGLNDYILMTNDDNYYVPVFVDYMLKVTNHKTGIILCNTVHSHFQYGINNSVIAENGIDMGAFIVRALVAKDTGFNHEHFSADGAYAEECYRNCQKRGLIAVKVNKPLFVHN